MDTHNSATNATTPPATFPPLAVGHERHNPAEPVGFDPATHGHALVVARRDGGLSTMLRRLAAAAHTAGATVATFALQANDTTAPNRLDAATPHGQDDTAEFLDEDLDARHEAVDADGVTFTHPPLFVVVDDMETTEQSVHALVRRVLDEGAAVGVHALVGTHADPMGGWLAVEGYRSCGFRLVRATALTLVRRLVYDGRDAGLVPAPSWPGRWVARTPERVVTVTAPY